MARLVLHTDVPPHRTGTKKPYCISLHHSVASDRRRHATPALRRIPRDDAANYDDDGADQRLQVMHAALHRVYLDRVLPSIRVPMERDVVHPLVLIVE